MSTPTTVEVGQMWRDRDQRTKGSGEFTVVAVVGSRHGDTTYLPGQGVEVSRRVTRAAVRIATNPRVKDSAFPFAIVRRETGRLTSIRVSRLLHGPYELIGRAR